MKNLILITTAFLMLYLRSSVTQGTSDDKIPRVSYCDLLSVPQNYDKKLVTTATLVGSSFHSVAVYDPKCMSTTTNNRSASLELSQGWNSTLLGKKLSKALRHGHAVQVTFEGIFYGSGGPYGGDGTKYRFIVQRLISVEEVLKKETNRSLPTTTTPTDPVMMR
jgi:hypothetical protein